MDHISLYRRRLTWLGACIFTAIVSLGIWVPRVSYAAGPTLTWYSDTAELYVMDTAVAIISLPGYQDVQALRLVDDNEYYVLVLLQKAHTLTLQLYMADGTLLTTKSALTLEDKTVSVSRLDYDPTVETVRVQVNVRNSKKKPVQVVTKWFEVDPSASLVAVQDKQTTKIHYPGDPAADETDADGLAFFNWERAASGLLPVERLTVLDDKCALHAEYMRRNDVITHYEEEDLPGYTADGYAAGTESDLTSQYNTSFYNGVDILTAAIYHRLPMLRNNLHHIGWAISDFSDAGFRYGCLNVYATEAWDVTYTHLQVSENYVTVYDPDNHEPLPYPGVRQKHIPIDFITGETPDPLADFGGSYPAGFPISLIFPYEDEVTDMSVQLLDSTDASVVGYFRGPNDVSDPNTAYQGNAIIFIPQDPLEYDTTYRVKVTGTRNDQTYVKKWRFTTEATDANHPWDTE